MIEGVMSNSFGLIQDSADKYKLGKTLTAINVSYTDGESGLVIGQCKSLVESLCRSILDESKISTEANISVSKLAKKAGNALNIGGEHGQDKKTREAYIQLINSFTNSLENAVHSIGTLRNEYCTQAHGRSTEHQPLHIFYAQFVASQTDALIVFFLNLIEHRKHFVPHVQFAENEDFNEYLTEEFGEIEIYGDLYQAPEILYNMNEDKYRTALNEYKEGASNDE